MVRRPDGDKAQGDKLLEVRCDFDTSGMNPKTDTHSVDSKLNQRTSAKQVASLKASHLSSTTCYSGPNFRTEDVIPA